MKITSISNSNLRQISKITRRLESESLKVPQVPGKINMEW